MSLLGDAPLAKRPVRGKERAPRVRWDRGAKRQEESAERITLSREESMRPTAAAADTIRTLIAAVPDDRLRDSFSTSRSPPSPFLLPMCQSPLRNGRRRRGRGKAPVTARASTRSTAAAVPISTRSTPSAGRSDAPRAARPPATPQAPRPQTEGQRRRRPRQRRRYGLRRQPCGSTPRNWSPSSPGGRWCASSASAKEPLDSLTIIWPCQQTSVPWRQPASLLCKREYPSYKGSLGVNPAIGRQRRACGQM